jgi:CBS domain containing-hemolysin-like protein
MDSILSPPPGSYIALSATVIFLLLLSAFFSGSETAFFSLPRQSVAGMATGGRRSRRVASLLSEPRKLLVSILFGNLLVNIANTSAVTVLAIRLFGERGVGYSALVMTILILIFGEIVPKSLAIRDSPVISIRVAPLMQFFMVVFYPFRLVLGRIADTAARACRRLFGEREERYGARELAVAVEAGHREGLFDEFEKEFLTNLFMFAETTVHGVLTPRVEVFSLDVDTPLQEALIRIRSRGYTRVPLYEGEPENIVGILHAKDLLLHARDERIGLRDLVRPVDFVPETKNIRDLLGDLITSHRHVVIAVDEHGSFEGIVTLEDILEEIFGEIRDRREPPVQEYMMTGEDSIIVEGTMSLEDLGEVFRADLVSKEVETIAGYLIEEIGRIPREGETFNLGDLRFLVISAGRTRIDKMKIERLNGRGSEDGH